MNTKSIVVVLCAFALILGGCTPPLSIPTALPNPLVEVFIDDPASDLGVAQGTPVGFHVHVALRGPAVYRAELLANGALFLALTQEGDYSYSALWIPARAGEYYIQARVTLTDDSRAVSEPLRICVWPFERNPQSALPPIAGYTGMCPLPAPNRNQATTGNVGLRVVASPSVVQFFDDPGCAYVAPQVAFLAYVDDPQDLVVLVTEGVIRPDGRSMDLEYLNWITTRPSNQKEYRRTIALPPDTVAGTPIYATGNLTWFVYAWGRDGQLVGSTRGHLTYAHVRCRGALLQIGPSPTPTTQVLHLAPSETPTLTPAPLAPPRFTFNKNAFCRRGPDTSFPDVTAIASGDTVDILNVSEDGFWYYVFWKQFDAKCWVAASTGLVNGDATGIKVLIGPELPSSGPGPKTPPGPEPAPVPCNPLIRVCP